MEKFLKDLIEYLMPQNDIYLYIFLFLSAVVENLFPPIPGDTITALGAFLVGTGRLDYFLVYISTTLGSVLGFMTLFMLGRFLDKEFFIKKDYRYFPAKSIISAENWFARYGYFIVLGNRFLPGIRSAISIVSGISKLNILKVFIFSLISATIWNLIWIHAGFLLGTNWDIVRKRLGEISRTYNITVGIVIIIFIAGFFIVKRLRRRRKDRD